MAKPLKFNPSFQSDEEAIENFVVRQEELDRIVREFDPHAGGSARVLVAAPRGAGKTTLCRRFLAEVHRSGDLRAHWEPIYLGEENYSVTTPGEFFLECLARLRDQVATAEMERSYAAAAAVRTEENLLQETLEHLRDYVQSAAKKLLIVVENFHTILEDQMIGSKAGSAKALLKNLANDELFGVLATSVVQPSNDDTVAIPKNYIKIELKPLSLPQCKVLWKALTGADVAESKLRPLEILTGGSPRMIHILAAFMKMPSLADLMNNLNRLIDENTEYFKSQLDGLAAMERKVFATLLDLWDPCTAKQVAEAARVTTNAASSMLNRLADRGHVMKTPGDGRAIIYYAAERLFNIYYLMRRRSHPSDRVRALVAFMVAYYDSEELADTTAMLAHEACKMEPSRRDDYHWTFHAIMSRAPRATVDKILTKTPTAFMEPYGGFIKSFRSDQQAHREKRHYLTSSTENSVSMNELISEIEAAADANNIGLARRLVRRGIELYPHVTEFQSRLAWLEVINADYVAAARAAEKAIDLNHEDAWAYALLGYALLNSGRVDDAEVRFKEALGFDAKQSLALTSLSGIYEKRGEITSALGLFAPILQAGGLKDTTRSRYADLLRREGRAAEAEAVLRESASLQDNVRTRRSLVSLLEHQDRQNEAIELLEEIAERSGKWQAWAELGSYLKDRVKNYQGAARAFRTAIDKSDFVPSLYGNLAHALWDDDAPDDEIAAIARRLVEHKPVTLQALVTAGEIFEIANDDQSAEVAYRSALPLEEGSNALFPLGLLIQRQPNRREESEQILRDAVAQTDGRWKCAPASALAEMLVHDGNDKEARRVIVEALEANDRCACCLALDADICRRNGDVDTAKRNYRRALELKKTNIEALTGLSRLVSGAEAEDLIAEAIKVAPDHWRPLLARAQNATDPQVRVKDALAALESEPSSVETHLFLALELAQQDDISAAIAHIRSALDHLSLRKELLPSFVDTAIRIAVKDDDDQLTDSLAKHEKRQLVEPLFVAIQMVRGENPRVAKEIFEVAADIVARSMGGVPRMGTG